MIWALIFAALFSSGFAFNLPDNKENLFSPEDNDAALLAVCDDIVEKFEKEYINFMKTGIESPALRKMSQQLAKSHSKRLFDTEIEHLDKRDQFAACVFCQATVNVVVKMFRPGGELYDPSSEAILKSTMLDFCDRFEIQTEEVCDGLFELNYPIIRFILDNSEMTSRAFCGTFMQASFCSVKDTTVNWTLPVDSNGPAIEGPKADIPVKGENDLNILHITDIHYDPLYVVGSLAECDEPLCCQRNKESAEGTPNAAGYWGDYRYCDSPLHAIEDSLKSIKNNHEKIDYIYHTGDVIDHAVWITSREKNSKSLEVVNEKLKSTFGDIQVFPTIGNHENNPLNVFAPVDISEEELSPKWLYEKLADLWSVWLPDHTKETIERGGFYTVSPQKGFRIIALNNNDCYVFNWWIVYNGNYLSEQLIWLHDILLESEAAGEYVHILAHIPTGTTSCWNVWSREFSRIVRRFRNTISGIFNGHTHTDELSVYFSDAKEAVNIAWNGGSLTPFANKNPNYKIYQVEPETYQVVEQETWYYNLTAANLKPDESPTWELEYKMTEAFGLADLSPASIDGLLTKFSENPKLLRKYWEFYVVKGDPHLENGCNDRCLKKLICLLARSDNTKTERCEELQLKLEESLENETEESGDGSGEGSGDEDGGASAIIALKITTILSIYFGLKLFL